MMSWRYGGRHRSDAVTWLNNSDFKCLLKVDNELLSLGVQKTIFLTNQLAAASETNITSLQPSDKANLPK